MTIGPHSPDSSDESPPRDAPSSENAPVDRLEAEIDRRCRAEQALADTRDWFVLLLDSAAEGMYAIGPDGRCTFCNAACARLLGYADPADLIGRPIHALVHQASADGTPCPPEGVHAVQASPRHDGVQVNSGVFRRRDGTSFPVEYWTHPIRRANRVMGSVVTFLDSTEHHQTRRSLEQLSRAIAQTADSVFITDCAGTIEYVNPAFEALTGFSGAEAIGSTARLVRSGVHDERFYDNLWKTILSGGIFRFVVTNRSKDGRLFDEDQTISPIRDAAGTITHFVSTGRDITHRRRTEEALRRLNHQLEVEVERIASVLHDEAGQFLSSAHITLADVARDVPPAVQARLGQVRQHLDQVEEQLRRVSHELHPRILADLGLLDAIRFFGEAFARRSGVHLTIDVDLDVPCSRGVETVLYRFVQEALTNMGKHAGATAGFVFLRREGSRLVCSIRDNGAGFDPEAVNVGTKNGGLGLALMRDRLVAVGGSLEILSAPGAGTQLRTTIPIEA